MHKAASCVQQTKSEEIANFLSALFAQLKRAQTRTLQILVGLWVLWDTPQLSPSHNTKHILQVPSCPHLPLLLHQKGSFPFSNWIRTWRRQQSLALLYFVSSAGYWLLPSLGDQQTLLLVGLCLVLQHVLNYVNLWLYPWSSRGGRNPPSKIIFIRKQMRILSEMSTDLQEFQAFPTSVV